MHKIALFLSGALIVGPLPAQELHGNSIVLLPEQAAHCRAVGCHVIPQDQLQEGLERIVRKAYDAGVASCKNKT